MKVGWCGSCGEGVRKCIGFCGDRDWRLVNFFVNLERVGEILNLLGVVVWLILVVRLNVRLLWD